MRSNVAASVSSIVLGALICPAAVLTLGLIAGCGGGTSKTPPPPPPPEIGVTINPPTTKAIQCGTAKGLVTLTATVTGSTNGNVTWSSSNSGALDVDSTTGAITPGTSCDDKTQMATITATSKADTSKTATIDMQLVDQVLVAPGNGTIKIVNTDGSGATTIVPVSAGCSGPEMGSSHMKFVCQDAADTNTVYLYTTDTTAGGTVPTKINVGIFVTVASLSPDEKSIAFVSPYGASDGAHQRVYVVDLATITSTGTDSTGAKTATATPKLVYTGPPTQVGIGWIGWTPDGKMLLTMDVANEYLGEIPADGSTQKLTDITSVPATFGYFVEDPATKRVQTMYFTAFDGTYSATPANATPEKISPYAMEGISPSGKRLALYGSGNIYTSDTSGNTSKPLTQGFSVSY